MKKLSVLIISILGAVAIATAAPTAPRGQTWKPQKSLTTVEDFKSLNVGDTIAQVCKACDTVSTTQIKSTEQAMAYCKEGAIADCPSCQTKTKIVFRGPRTTQSRTIVRYVDDHGEACIFMMKIQEPAHSSLDHGAHTPHR